MTTSSERPHLDAAVRRSLVSGSTLGLGVTLVAALLLIVNYFGWKYHQRFDWTSTRLYTLSEKSEGVLASLEQDVTAVVFLQPESSLFDPVRELLARYQAKSPRIKVRYVDPARNPLEAQQLVSQYEVTSANVVVFDSGSARRIVEENDLADFDYSGMQFGEGPQMTGFKGEQRFTSALLELQEPGKPKVVFTSGHGEASLDDGADRGLTTAQEILTRDNYEVEEWASLGSSGVPADADLVVIAGPTASFVEPELEVLERYLAGGGRLLVLLDPAIQGSGAGLRQTNLEPLLARHGVEVGQDVVVDPSNVLPMFGPETIFVNAYAEHPISATLSQAQVPSILPVARSIKAAAEVPAGSKATELMRSSANGWAERDLANLTNVAQDARDLPGPVALAVAVGPEEEALPANPGEDEPAALAEGAAGTGAPAAAPAAAGAATPPVPRLVVIGDSDFATDGQIANAGNAALFGNAANWLMARENLLGIPPKAPEQVRLTLTDGQFSMIKWLVLAILPGLAITAGVLVSLRRRR